VRKLNSRTLRNLATQLLAKFGSVIGVDLSVEACARDGNVSEAGVEQVWVDAGIAVNEDAFCVRPWELSLRVACAQIDFAAQNT
jgi:hypothetical protein